MSGDVTYQALKRLTFLPERDSSDNGNVIAGQDYDNIYIIGGSISNIDLIDANISGGTVLSSTADTLTNTRAIYGNNFNGSADVTGIIGAQFGGTGVNNTGKTITLGGNISTGGAFSTPGGFSMSLTATGTTAVTMPTVGTLATLAGAETFTNKTLTSPIISTISNSGTITLPTGAQTLVGRTTTDTLTNKTLTSPAINTAIFIGGTVNNAVIGGSTPAAGTFTAISGQNINVTGTTNPANGMCLNSPNVLALTANGMQQAVILGSASAINYFQLSGGATGVAPAISAQGEAAVGLVIYSSGTGDLEFKTSNAATVNMRMKSSGSVQFAAAASFSINGTVATLLGSLGPVGSHTTVQSWLTVLDSGGTTRYIPCF